MGRRPSPTVLKLAKGERRPSRVNYAEPDMPAPASIAPPKGLSGPGLREWTAQITLLTQRGVLTESDLTGFQDYCLALTDLRSYETKAKRAGLELAIAKGYFGAVIKLRAQVNQLRQQCGLTPSSRSTIKAAAARKPGVANTTERYLSVLGGKSSA